MNILTIENKKIVGYNIYDFLKYYQDKGQYTIDKNENGYLFIYEQYFPKQLLKAMLINNKLSFNDIDSYLENRINFLYNLSYHKMDIINEIYFFYPFTYYSEYEYDFNLLGILKKHIHKKFNKKVNFVLNNFFNSSDFIHFNAFRYDIFNNARIVKKEQKELKKQKLFICLNAKIRKHRDDLEEFVKDNNLNDFFYFSYTEKNIHIWKTRGDFKKFGKKYLRNENNSGHHAFEYYLNDDFFNTKNGIFFDQSFYYIITETSYDDNVCFISEKTYKAFYHKIPFIVIGNPHTLKNLKKEGFKTFDKWIDEGYDDELNYEIRKKKIFNEITRLSKLNEDEHLKIINEMNYIVEFNHKHFLDTSNFKNDFNYIFKG